MLGPTFLSLCGLGEEDKLPEGHLREGVLVNFLTPIISVAAAVRAQRTFVLTPPSLTFVKCSHVIDIPQAIIFLMNE